MTTENPDRKTNGAESQQAQTQPQQETISYFGYGEKDFFNNWAEARTRFFRPVCSYLHRYGITADHLTLAGLYPMLFLFFPMFYLRLRIMGYFILGFHLLMDAIDGPMARFQGVQGNKGALLDMVDDLTGMGVVVITAVHFGYLFPFIGMVYVFSYLYMIVLSVGQNLAGNPFRFVVKTKYPFYILFVLKASYGVDWLDPFAAIASIYMVIHSIYAFRMLRKKL